MKRLMKLEIPAIARIAVKMQTPRETFFGPTTLRITRARLSEPPVMSSNLPNSAPRKNRIIQDFMKPTRPPMYVSNRPAVMSIL